MKIEWLGHACFLVTGAKGTRVITDPYATGEKIMYQPVNAAADVVLVSHGHFDHNNVAAVQGKPEVVTEAGKHRVAGLDILGVQAFHDGEQGQQRGKDVIYTFSVDGIRLCHLGDLGHPLSDAQVKEIGAVDVLFIPVGGFYTLDVAQANELCNTLKPKVVIPMHYKTSKLGLPIATVDEFLAKRTQVRRVKGSSVELVPGKLPAQTETVVLEPAR